MEGLGSTLRPRQRQTGSDKEDNDMLQRLICPLVYLAVGLASAGSGLAAQPTPAADGTDREWQLRMLFEPSDQQLELEKRGRVMIYRGLRDTDIDRVMRQQFGRVESMMFIRTVLTDKQGEVERDRASGVAIVQDDGCE